MSYKKVDFFWKNQPPYPKEKIFDHPLKYSGFDRIKKIKNLKKILKTKKLDYYFLSSLDNFLKRRSYRLNSNYIHSLTTPFGKCNKFMIS